eukprot:15455153-Alexandrium_andersonii.AAC.1
MCIRDSPGPPPEKRLRRHGARGAIGGGGPGGGCTPSPGEEWREAVESCLKLVEAASSAGAIVHHSLFTCRDRPSSISLQAFQQQGGEVCVSRSRSSWAFQLAFGLRLNSVRLGADPEVLKWRGHNV